MFVKGDTFCDIFKELRTALIGAPIVSPRNQATKELLSVSFELTNPRNRLIYHPKRKYNYAFNVAEMISYLSGINSVQYMDFWNSNYKNFSDNGVNFRGNYGERLKFYITELIEKLRSNPDTRQATLSIYNSEDMMRETKDAPCTLALDFKIRNKKLHMHVFMRSNDLIWGLMYDLPAFTMMQEILANTVGVELGSYNHTAASLHVYEKHWQLLTEMYDVEFVEMKKINETYENILAYGNVVNRMAIDLDYYSSFTGHLIDSLWLYKLRKLDLLNYTKIDFNKLDKYLVKIMELGGNI